MLVLRDASTSTKTAQVSNLQTLLAPRKLLVGRIPQKKACKRKFLVNLAGVPHLSLAQGHQICFIVKQRSGNKKVRFFQQGHAGSLVSVPAAVATQGLAVPSHGDGKQRLQGGGDDGGLERHRLRLWSAAHR